MYASRLPKKSSWTWKSKSCEVNSMISVFSLWWQIFNSMISVSLTEDKFRAPPLIPDPSVSRSLSPQSTEATFIAFKDGLDRHLLWIPQVAGGLFSSSFRPLSPTFVCTVCKRWYCMSFLFCFASVLPFGENALYWSNLLLLSFCQ